MNVADKFAKTGYSREAKHPKIAPRRRPKELSAIK
jgi:hypothetical protein